MATYKKQVLYGTKWTLIQQVAIVVLGLVRLSVLARLLQKETFGLFAITMLLLGFTQIFTDLGIGVALFSEKNITKVQYSTLYWTNIILSLLLYVILIFLIPVSVWYFETEALHQIVPVIGLNLLFGALGKHFSIYAQKDLKFKAIAIIQIATTALGVIIAIILALKDFEIFALVDSVLFTTLTGSISFFFLMRKKYPLAFVLKFNKVASFFRIGIYQSLSQIVDFVASQLDVILIGRILDLDVLGVYNLLKQFTIRIYALINNIIKSVAVPIFSEFNKDDFLLRKRYLEIVDRVSFLNSLIYTFIAFMSYEILNILYGPSYSSYSFVFALFSLMYFLSSVASLAGVLVVAKGKTQYGLSWTIFRVLLTFPLIYFFGMKYGLNGVVFGLLIFFIQAIYTYWRFLINKVQNNLTFKDHLMSFVPSMMMGWVIFLISSLIFYFIPSGMSFVLTLIVKLAIFSLVSSVYIRLLKKEQLHEVLDLLKIKRIKSK